MNNPLDVEAQAALDRQLQQLRMIRERLNYVRDRVPAKSKDWRGPAQRQFDDGLLELMRKLAIVEMFLSSAEDRTSNALSMVSSRVG